MQKQPIENSRQAITLMIARLLSGEYLLYSKTREAHWNMYIPSCSSNCVFFENQFIELAQIIDSLTDCLPTTGNYDYGMLNPFSCVTATMEIKYHKYNSYGYILDLLQDHQSIIDSLYHYLNPVLRGSEKLLDFELLEVVIRKHERMAVDLRFRLAAHQNKRSKPIVVQHNSYTTSAENYAYAF